jgi:hypothetical protein
VGHVGKSVVGQADLAIISVFPKVLDFALEELSQHAL